MKNRIVIGILSVLSMEAFSAASDLTNAQLISELARRNTYKVNAFYQATCGQPNPLNPGSRRISISKKNYETGKVDFLDFESASIYGCEALASNLNSTFNSSSGIESKKVYYYTVPGNTPSAIEVYVMADSTVSWVKTQEGSVY